MTVFVYFSYETPLHFDMTLLLVDEGDHQTAEDARLHQLAWHGVEDLFQVEALEDEAPTLAKACRKREVSCKRSAWASRWVTSSRTMTAPPPCGR